MRKLLLLLMLILIGETGSSFAQGTVSFRNSDIYLTMDPTGGDRLVYDVGSPLNPVTGVGLTGTQWVAELYAGSNAGSLSPLTASISRFRGTTTLNKGKWGNSTLTGASNNPTTLPGTVPGDTVFLQVVVWNYEANGGTGNPNNTFVNATGPKGQSLVFTYKVPNPSDPPANFFMENLQAFGTAVPEPCALAVSILGAAGLLLMGRGKRL